MTEEWDKIIFDNRKLTYYQTNMHDYYATDEYDAYDDEMAGCEEVVMVEIEK